MRRTRVRLNLWNRQTPGVRLFARDIPQRRGTPPACPMPTSIDEFWKLAIAARLLDAATCKRLQAQFGADKDGVDATDATALARWLVRRKKLSRYQAAVLLSGRPGPFVFGDFVITARIESGRLAQSFRAVHKRNHTVLLVFAPSTTATAASGSATTGQFQIARAIQDPHVARVLRYESTAVPPYFVLEDLRGASLCELLNDNKPPLDDAYRIAWHAALGLAAIHDGGATHGALRPDNVWVDGRTAKLLQFPLATLDGPAERLRGAAVDYLAPELADASHTADRTSDIYALGCIMYELVAGRVPFDGGTAEERLARHQSETIERLDGAASGVDTALAELVAAMLTKSPGSRVRNARDVADALESIIPTVRQKPGANAPTATTEAADETRRAGPAPVPTAPTTADRGAPVEKPLATAIPIRRASQSAEADVATPSIVVDQSAGDRAAEPAGSTRPRRRISAPVLGIGAGLVLVVAVALAAWLTMAGGTASPPRGATVAGKLTRSNSAGEQVSSGSAKHDDGASKAVLARPAPDVNPIDDDGRTLWISPTAGESLDVRYVPSSAQVILAMRPAELFALDEGTKVIEAIGPGGTAVIDRAQETLGVDLGDIKQLTVAFVPDASGAPQATYAMRLAKPVSEQELLTAWGDPQPITHKSHTIYQRGSLAYYLPPGEQGHVAVIAPTPLMKQLLDHGGDPLLRRGIRQLLRASDSARHVNLVLTPSYLLTDGKSLLQGKLARLHGPLEQCFDMRVQAVLASAHMGEELFLELRAVGPSDVRPEQLAQQLHERLVQQGERLEHYLAALSPQPYGRLIVHRFPRMVQLATSFTRFAGEDRQAVLRCYLPASAAHNLVLGAELTLFEHPDASPADASGQPGKASPSVGPLDRIVSLSFPRDTLERTMELLSAEMGIPIMILGADLQLEGITKNQSFALDERDQPARQVLLKVLKLANPDGKLVYVPKLDAAGNKTLVITTRAAAARRGDALPPEFEENSSGKVP